MELREALLQIDHIRHQMARTQVFRGYRSLTTAFTGAVAVGTAIAHAMLRPMPIEMVLGLWVGAACLSVIVVGTEMAIRCIRSESALQRDLAFAAAEQFLPCVVAGALLTYVMLRFAPAGLWMLPGLWAMLFAMGVLASRPVLPRGITIVGAFYLMAGLVYLAVAPQGPTFSPWAMGAIFGAGQSLAAGVLWWSLERNHAWAQ